MVRTYSDNKVLVKQKRKQIVKLALPILFEKGYHKTSMREIAEVTNMSPGAIYHYIGKKEDILHLIAEYTSERMTSLNRHYKEISQKDAVETLKKTLFKFLQICDSDQDLILFINREIKYFPKDDLALMLDSQVNFIQIFEDILQKGVESKRFIPHDARLAAFDIVVLGNHWANSRWFLKRHYSLEKYYEEQLRRILTSVSKDQTTKTT